MDEPESCMSGWEVDQTAGAMQGDYIGLNELLAVIDDPAFGNEFVGNLLRSKLPELRAAIEALTQPAPDSVALVKAERERLGANQKLNSRRY